MEQFDETEEYEDKCPDQSPCVAADTIVSLCSFAGDAPSSAVNVTLQGVIFENLLIDLSLNAIMGHYAASFLHGPSTVCHLYGHGVHYLLPAHSFLNRPPHHICRYVLRAEQKNVSNSCATNLCSIPHVRLHRHRGSFVPAPKEAPVPTHSTCKTRAMPKHTPVTSHP